MGGIVYYWMKESYIKQTKESLLENIKLIALEVNHHPNLDMLALQIKEQLNLRVTFIDLEGNILAESDKDKMQMENHKYRDEVIQATTEEFGCKIRHSKTVDKDLLYMVKMYNEPTKSMYIRLAKELKSINSEIYSIGLKVAAVLVLFFIAVFSITYKINIQINHETQKVANFLKELTKKKKPTYISSNFSKEFFIITSLLTKISQILIKKEKQKSKYTSKLELSNKQKDDIISAISHEFKNPIAVINGYSQTLLDDPNLNPNIRNKFLSKIYKNGNKLSDLIDTLRLSIKLDSGQQSMTFITINLYEIIHDAVENIKINYPSREAIIKGEKSITIQADYSLFSVVITNLIENAFKYSEDEVVIEFDSSSIRVIDTGIGISASNLEKITSKFYRVHENNWNNSLGLGLFIVSNIINLHNFKLSIISKENEGSTFSINF